MQPAAITNLMSLAGWSSILDLTSLSLEAARGELAPGSRMRRNVVTDPTTIHTLAAAAALVGNPINVQGITSILGSFFVIGVLVVAIRALFHAFRSNVAGVITIVGIVALAALVYGLGSAGLLGSLGSDMVRSFLSL